MRNFLLTIILTIIVAQPAFAGQLPDTKMDNLAGETVHFPADFQGKPTLIILAFAHEQREEAARVIALLQEAQETNSTLTWYELPIIDAPSVAHFFIRNGMRDGTDKALHSHIVPQFVDEDDWRKSTDISSKVPLLAKVDHNGMIQKSTQLNTIKSAEDILRF